MSTLTRSIARSLLLVAFVALVAPHAALSQIHPNHAQGFEPQRAFEVGDLENVNLFNGNLTLTLPIGQRYPVGGDFSYGLTLTYNGNVWEWEEDSLLGANGYEYFLEAIPMKRSNAGLGWELHLGRINPPRSQYSNSSNWVYESPDGALHELFPNLHSDGTQTAGYVYTQDGTYLRFDTSFRKLEHPDGSIQWFDTSGRLYAMEDRYGNSFGVSYPSNPTRWVITDDHNRTQTVYFKDAAYYGAGSRIAYHAYYPFGEEATAINQDTETMKFTGHERDLGNPSSAADDLDYLHARYFNPQLGRFLRIDPKGRYGALRAPQQRNRYCYAVGNPLAFIDPDGREIQLASETLRPFLVQTITRPSGRAILTRLDQSRQTVVFRDVKRNSDTVIMDARRGKLDSQKVHFELIGEIRSQSGERTGISIGIDAKAVEIAHPTDKTGVTTTAHGAHHAEAALGGMSIQEVRATGDNPTSEEGPAEQFGQRVAAEKPDLTEEQAEKYLDELLESKAQFEPK